jgi:type VI secretion system secreted protein VgrG
MSWIKTNSSPGGDGFNEIRFEDKKDKEQIFIHAERNMDVRVKHDSFERILNHRHQIIGWDKDGKKGGDQKEMVYQDKHLNIKRDQMEHIEGNVYYQIGGGEAEKGGTICTLINENDIKCVKKNQQLGVDGDRVAVVAGKDSLTVKGEYHFKASKNSAVESSQAIHIKAGTSLVIEAGTQLSLKVGGNFIDIGPAGVSIKGTMVMINSGGAAGSGAGSSPDTSVPILIVDPVKPEIADNSKTGKKSMPDSLS